jgi:ubiquinone biosynthesis protein
MIKALITLEGIGSQLDPNFQLFKILEEFSPRIFAHQYNRKNIRDTVYLTVLDYTDLIQELPEMLRTTQRFFKEKQLNISISGLRHFRETLDKIGFRLVNGLILSALLISSALIVLADVSPKWNGVPLIGITGFLIGGIMGLIFLIDGIVKFFRWKYKD